MNISALSATRVRCGKNTGAVGWAKERSDVPTIDGSRAQDGGHAALCPPCGTASAVPELLVIKPEMHHVAVGDDIFLAFQPQLAGIAGAGFAVQRDVIGIGDGLGPNEALLEIGMDDPGRCGRLGAAMDSPGAS